MCVCIGALVDKIALATRSIYHVLGEGFYFFILRGSIYFFRCGRDKNKSKKCA